ncbi:phosphate propanoyltransferase [Clostridium sp. D2Q-11]|uniref:Phosphate propanoyltransferase n=1 Tax=Anaeromonas frigoriresistens TaxID=2683708 RepID=A0A942Z822_9FIRM|nr:phosphate propanoyltransferase [Anaeromonas frigoriresistens]MBS4537848.1 phosphate propanoyltransferase [Anaeromonas frigoriresistens]
MDDIMIRNIVDKVIKNLSDQSEKEEYLPIEASARHVHLSKNEVEGLFGKGYRLTPKRELSQPGQFLSQERVAIIGPKGMFKNVAVLGPERKNTQVEISRTDAISLGVDAPVRESGNIKGSSSIFISANKNMIEIKEGAIVAKRHIHMPPKDAERFGLEDKQIVSVKVFSDRPVIFEDVLVRVNKDYRLNMHIDFDEANACNFKNGVKGQILTEKGK